jgi:hypothetical protein
MGMYDSILVHKTLLDKIIKDLDHTFDTHYDYYSFQTKDLDNSLTTFFIEEDGSFVWEKREYEYQEPDPDSDKKWNFGHLKLIGEPEKVKDERHAYIDFYDFYNTDSERVFVTFTAHVRNGTLSEPLTIKSVERVNLEEESIKHKKSREEWKKVTSKWQWNLAVFLYEKRYKITRLLDKLDTYLRDQAKKGTDIP